MKKQTYLRLYAPFAASAPMRRVLVCTDAAITGLVFLAYPVLLAVLFFQKDTRLLRCILVPAVGLLAVSAARKILNFPRPCETFEIEAVLNKEKRGESFPSRHAFSVFMIALTFFYIRPPFGIVCAVLGVLLAVCRVLGGAHFLRDVLVGAFIGIFAGILGFFVL